MPRKYCAVSARSIIKAPGHSPFRPTGDNALCGGRRAILRAEARVFSTLPWHTASKWG